MSVNRREFLKVSAVGLASLSSAACWGAKELHVRLRGLLLLQKLGNKVVVHGVDAAAVGMSFHRPVLRIRKSDIDHSANNLPYSRIDRGHRARRTKSGNGISRASRFGSTQQEPNPKSDHGHLVSRRCRIRDRAEPGSQHC